MTESPIDWQAAAQWLAGSLVAVLSWTAKTGVKEMKADMASLKAEQRHVAERLPLYDSTVDDMDGLTRRVDGHGNELSRLTALLEGVASTVNRIENKIDRRQGP